MADFEFLSTVNFRFKKDKDGLDGQLDTLLVELIEKYSSTVQTTLVHPRTPEEYEQIWETLEGASRVSYFGGHGGYWDDEPRESYFALSTSMLNRKDLRVRFDKGAPPISSRVAIFDCCNVNPHKRPWVDIIKPGTLVIYNRQHTAGELCTCDHTQITKIPSARVEKDQFVHVYEFLDRLFQIPAATWAVITPDELVDIWKASYRKVLGKECGYTFMHQVV